MDRASAVPLTTDHHRHMAVRSFEFSSACPDLLALLFIIIEVSLQIVAGQQFPTSHASAPTGSYRADSQSTERDHSHIIRYLKEQPAMSRTVQGGSIGNRGV